MKKRVRILFTFPGDASIYGIPTPDIVQRFEEILNADCEMVFPKTFDEEELLNLAKDAEIIIGANWFPRKVIENARRLRLIHTTGAGSDSVPSNCLQERDIIVLNTSGAGAVTVAEHAFALIMALSKNILMQHLKMKEGTWQRIKSVELCGKTLGIIGLGKIGIEVARIGKELRMSVVYHSRTRKRDVERDLEINYVGLDELLKDSDFVTLHVPLTDKTYHLIGRRELQLMKKTAFLINTSRGTIVDEKALYEALLRRQIAGAGIDTWYNYPLYYKEPEKIYRDFPPSKLGIHKLNNVVCTPHVAGYTNEFVERALQLIADNVRPMINSFK